MTQVDRLHKFEADTKWIGTHFEKLKQKHPDEWIAVHNGIVVAHGKNFESVLEALKLRFPNDYKHIPTEYINLKEQPLILRSKK